jgi:hypothetical protein
MIKCTFVALPFLMTLFSACTPSQAHEESTGHALVTTTSLVVDSAISIPEALSRVRADLTEHPTELSGGASSRGQLVERFVRAVEDQDTTTIRDLVLTRAEFAYLYYPFTPYTHPPMEMEPGLVWFLTQQNSEKGIIRVLRRLGGIDLGYIGYRCAPEPERQERNLLWSHCELELTNAPEDFEARRLFGTILERDGQFKLVSYANDF